MTLLNNPPSTWKQADSLAAESARWEAIVTLTSANLRRFEGLDIEKLTPEQLRLMLYAIEQDQKEVRAQAEDTLHTLSDRVAAASRGQHEKYVCWCTCLTPTDGVVWVDDEPGLIGGQERSLYWMAGQSPNFGITKRLEVFPPVSQVCLKELKYLLFEDIRNGKKPLSEFWKRIETRRKQLGGCFYLSREVANGTLIWVLNWNNRKRYLFDQSDKFLLKVLDKIALISTEKTKPIEVWKWIDAEEKLQHREGYLSGHRCSLRCYSESSGKLYWVLLYNGKKPKVPRYKIADVARAIESGNAESLSQLGFDVTIA